MATFERKTWTDRSSTYPNRRTLVDTTTGTSQTVDVQRAEGTVNTPGDAFSAANMNNLEGRIETVVNEMNSNFQVGVSEVYNACSGVGVTPSARTPQAISTAISTMHSSDDYESYGAQRYSEGQTDGEYTKRATDTNIATQYSSSIRSSLTAINQTSSARAGSTWRTSDATAVEAQVHQIEQLLNQMIDAIEH